MSLSNLPIVCLHGWGMRGAIWRDLDRALPDRVVHAPDLPGYGAEPMPLSYDVNTLATQLAVAAPEKIIVLGWSMGSLVAQAWARLFPEQVTALVLVSATPCFQQRPDWPQGLPAADVRAFAEGVTQDWRSTLNRFLSLQARGSEDAHTLIARLRAVLAEAGDPEPDTLSAGMCLLQQTDLRAEASRIRQPTGLIHGERDALCPLSGAEWLAGQLPSVRCVTIRRAAHAPFLSHPREFAAALTEFIDE